MSRRSVLLAASLMVFAVACSDHGGAVPRAGVLEDGLFTVVRGELPISLTENGTLVAKDSRQVTVESSRGGKIAWLIDAGKEVAEGDVLCRLDPTELTAAIQQTELEITKAEQEFAGAQMELELQKTENESTVEKAKIAEEKAKKELKRYEEGDGPQEKRKLLVAVKDRQTELTRKKKFYEDSAALVEQGFLKRSELEDHQIAFEKAQVEFEGAQLDVEMFTRYKYPMELAEKRMALADATRELDATLKRNERKLQGRQTDGTQAEKTLLQQRERLRKQRDDLDKFTLKAPCAGIVLHGDPKQPAWYRDQALKVGSEVYEDQTICTIPDLRVMQVKLQVHEADVNKLSKGLPATATMESMPGVVVTGTVTEVAPIAASNDFGNGDGVKRFDVQITLERKDGLHLRPGISAKVTIAIDHLRDVVYVPLQCVVVEAGVASCFLAKPGAGAIEKRQVEIGASNDNYLQIKTGLAAGDRVLLYNPSLSRRTSESAAPQQPGKPASESSPPDKAGPAVKAGS